MYVSILELKGQPPVAAYPDRPAARQSAFERMESISRHVHILDCLGSIQRRQLQSKSSGVIGLNAALLPGFKEAPQSFVPARFDHLESIARCASRNKAACNAIAQARASSHVARSNLLASVRVVER